ncbi:MAG: hypothetical protein JXB03_03180 [Spirochaetales bacterium]|nr:hypothetical protein [Spirochaetales bacterium]
MKLSRTGLIISILIIMYGCASNSRNAEGTPLVQETYSLERVDGELWQIHKESAYYDHFNGIHQAYRLLIDAAGDPAEKRRLFLERDLMIARERLNYMADEQLVKEVVGGTEGALGTNASKHLFRLQDVHHVPRQNFTPPDPENYVYEEVSPRFGSKMSDAITAIISFDRQLKKRGVQLIVVPVPNSSQVYAHQLHNDIDLEEVIWHPWAHMIVKLLEHDVEVLDLLDLYKAYSGDNTTLNYIDHHWGQAGLDIVGMELGQRFERFSFDEKYYIDPQKLKRSPISVSMPALIPHWDRLDAGYIRSRMGLGTQYETVRITYNGDVIDPVFSFEDSPVAIMGDSFIPHLAETSSGIYAHLAYHTRVIPYAMSQNAAAAKPPSWYMRTIAGQGKEPAVVIWEIYGSAFNQYTSQNDWHVVKMPEPDESLSVQKGAVAKTDQTGKHALKPLRDLSWVEGDVLKVSYLPKREDLSTYPDALYAFQLRVTKGTPSGPSPGETIVVYRQFLKDYETITENIHAAGDRMGLYLEGWTSVGRSDRYISTMQLIDDLDDFESELYFGHYAADASGMTLSEVKPSSTVFGKSKDGASILTLSFASPVLLKSIGGVSLKDKDLDFTLATSIDGNEWIAACECNIPSGNGKKEFLMFDSLHPAKFVRFIGIGREDLDPHGLHVLAYQ